MKYLILLLICSTSLAAIPTARQAILLTNRSEAKKVADAKLHKEERDFLKKVEFVIKETIDEGKCDATFKLDDKNSYDAATYANKTLQKKGYEAILGTSATPGIYGFLYVSWCEAK